MIKTIEQLSLEVRKAKFKRDLAELEYQETKSELYDHINKTVGNSPETLVNIPDNIALSASAFRNYVLARYPEATITHMDFEKRIVRIFTSAEYQRFTYEDKEGNKIERRVIRGKSEVDLDLLRMLDEDLYARVVKMEPVLDEIALRRIMKEDEQAEETVVSAIISTKPKTQLHFDEKKEKN